MANMKVNMSLTKAEMPEQDPIVRAGNFDEVALGYDAETAMKEAARCLDCKNSPCRTGCPVAVKIPRFLEKVRDGDFDAHEVDFDSLIKRAAFYKDEQDAAAEHICRMTGGKRHG